MVVVVVVVSNVFKLVFFIVHALFFLSHFSRSFLFFLTFSIMTILNICHAFEICNEKNKITMIQSLHYAARSRRSFLAQAGGGFGALALASLLGDEPANAANVSAPVST